MEEPSKHNYAPGAFFFMRSEIEYDPSAGRKNSTISRFKPDY